MTPAIRASGVVVDYGRVRALDSVDLEIAPGCVTGLVGMLSLIHISEPTRLIIRSRMASSA